MKVLAINPGSTSTKIAVYTNESPVFVNTIRHSVNELAPFHKIIDQYEFRKNLILHILKTNHILLDFNAVIGRGGLIKPIPGGVYEVNNTLKHDLIYATRSHASNLGGLIAAELASTIPGCRAFIADPVVVDELEDIARISGSPLLPRVSIFHALNHKATARRYARDTGTKYEEINLIVCHMGGGISVAAHRLGKVIDVNNALDGEGPFSPERAGTLPAGELINLCFANRYSEEDLHKLITGHAGLTAHLGTTDIIRIIDRIENQEDKHAELIINAMIYNIAKAIGSAAVVLHGKIDAIILTGGIAYSDYIILRLKEYVSFLGKIKVYPGENEMEALAINALGVLNGELPVQTYN